MTNHPNLIGRENRLIFRTLADFGQVAPVNARAAEEAVRLQNANRQTERYVNPDADLVERMVQTNFDYSKATPQEIARHEEGLRLANAGPAPSGVNPARGVQTAQQQTYANKAAGLDTTFNQETGVTQAAGQGGIEQSAIDNMRRNGLSEDEIRANLSSPDRMNSIRTTMSNTGLGGTDRQSAVLTPAQAQNILANSRNPRERAEAQKALDTQVNQVKGYNDVPIYDDNGNITGYNSVESKGKTAEAQQRERDRLATEEANRLKSQENADKLKKFTAGIDTSQIDQTKTQLDQIMGSIANLSPDLQAAVLPGLISLQQSNNEHAKLTQEIIGSQPTDAEIEAQYGGVEEYIKSEDIKYKDLLAKNLQTSKDIAEYNRDMLEADKAISDHDATVSEQKQMVANVEGEKKLRRQLNRLGIQTDTSGLNYLQSEIQKGVDALENLKTSNNLVSLKAQLAIGEGYRLEVKQAMETYEGKYLEITSYTTGKLQDIKNSINTAKADRSKAIIEAKKEELAQKDVNDRETRATIASANRDMATKVQQQKQDARQSESDALDKIDYLLKNYPRESVASAIAELGKSVTSFDVQALINNPTLGEIKSAAAKYSSSGGPSSYFPSSMQSPTPPSVSYVEFEQQKVDALQNKEMKTFSAEKKAEVIAQNEVEWKKQYDATFGTASVTQAQSQIVQQFGQPTVDAASAVLNGTYGGTNPVKNAAKAFGVSEAEVASAVVKLRQSGQVADTSILSPDQQSAWNGLRNNLTKDPYYTTYQGSVLALSRIETALAEKNGVSDIAAINGFQNGIVDPNATVRSEDVALIQSAKSWASKVDLNYWKVRAINGAKLPQEVRDQMLVLSRQISKSYEQAYADNTLPRFKQEVTQAGLPQTVLDSYGGSANTPSVSTEVQKFADTYFSQ